jgi:glycosyltransferase involved in cell wall biosynthesis
MADLSFVVISHNLSGYIEACLRSVTMPLALSTEIIVVDDASTDGTLVKIKDFAAANPKAEIKVLSTAGSGPRGPGHARNLGVSNATASKIAFVDGDDWIGAGAYANLVTLMDRHGAEMGWLRSLVYHERKAEFWPFYDDDTRREVLAGKPFVVTNILAHPQIGSMEPQCCNRVFDADFLRGQLLPFPEGIIYEDLPFHYRTIFSASRIVLTDEAGHYYRTQRRGKITDRNDEARFHLAQALEIATSNTFDAHPDALAGPYVLSFLAQFAHWCVMSVPSAMRPRLLEVLSSQFNVLPLSWRKVALQPAGIPHLRAYALWLLLHNNLRTLEQLSDNPDLEPEDHYRLETGRRELPPRSESAPPKPSSAKRPRWIRHLAGLASRVQDR